MTDHVEHFPTEIQLLSAFEGAIDAFRLPAENADVLFASYPAGTSIPPHQHETHNVGVITKGTLYLTVADQRTAYGVGDWYRLPVETEHAADFDEDTALIEFWFRDRPN